MVKELSERERRRNNVVLFRIPEVSSNLKTDVAKKDIETLIKLGAEINVPITDDDVKKISRIGKKIEDKCRPVLVELKSSEKKREIFKNVGRLGESENVTLKRMIIEHDMTPEERSELKVLRESAKKQEEDSAGNFRFRVRGPPWNRFIKKIPVRKGREQAPEVEDQQGAVGGENPETE